MIGRFAFLAVAAALAGAVPASATELVANGGFETGDFTGWTQFGDGSFTSVDNGTNFSIYAGGHSAYFGPLAPGGIQQTLSANIGDVVTVSFAYAEAFGSTGETMDVTLGSVAVFHAQDFTNETYTVFSGTFTVADANPVLTFTFTDPPDYVLLDGVSVGSVPAPGALALAGVAGLAMRRRRR